MVTSLRLFTVDTPDVARVHQFYSDNYDHHLMPRTLPELRQIAEGFEMYALEDVSGDVVAAAYVNGPEPDAENQEYEFGGILFHPRIRKTAERPSIAFPFCALVLGTVLAQDAEKIDGLIAHTHVANSRPHSLLERLGFAPSDDVACLDGAKVPDMRCSIDGKVWGITRVYLRPWLAKDLAQTFIDFDGTLAGRPTAVEFGDEDFEWEPAVVAETLRKLAT